MDTEPRITRCNFRHETPVKIHGKIKEKTERNTRKMAVIKKTDRKNRFVSMFNTQTGAYIRSGVIDENGCDTGEDPFMASFPELIDVGIMGWCKHGSSGLCMKSGVQCYQNGLGTKYPNMTFDNFKRIVDECRRKTFQFALGGRGDVDQHEDFERILRYCRDNDIIPNFTSSGLGFDDRIVGLCKELCGAVAVSWYRQEHTMKAIRMLLDAGIKTNIHYVLGKNSIDEAISRLKDNTFPDGINAIVFLLHKPVGLGTQDNVLDFSDKMLAEFFGIVDAKRGKTGFKIGFDSCTVPAIINMTSNINWDSIDTCEGGRWSAYISSDMKMMPCSFDNQELRWAYDISNDTIQNAWDSPQFDDFRNHFRNSCSRCVDRRECMGGCPIRRNIVLCGRNEKDLYESLCKNNK